MEQNENVTTPNGPSASNGMATAALILGIVSVIFCWLWWLGGVAGILAIVLGVMGKNKIKNNPKINYGGSGAAIAGLVLGIIGIIIACIIAYVAYQAMQALTNGTGAEEFLDALQKATDSLATMDTLTIR